MVSNSNSFTVWDYIVFLLTIVVSLAIGIFFAFRGNKQTTQQEYLLGGRSMSVVPVAISMLVSTMSAILIVGTPAEMYLQGTELYMTVVGNLVGSIFIALFVVPLLYPLGLTSAQEYLMRRYNSRAVTLLATVFVIISHILYMGTCGFAPATAFEIVTGIPIWITLLVAGAVTTFYTTIGGIKAVIWTDVFQSIIMVGGMLAIVIQGTLKVGGFARVWDINDDYERIRFFTVDFDPRVRHTVFSVMLGTGLGTMGLGFNQPIVQRFSSLPTLRRAQVCMLTNQLGAILLTTLACFTGVVMFAYYADQNCDPLSQGLVDNSNQLIPYFVMEILAYPPVPGLFMASLFAGSFSSMSSSMNALAAIGWEDMLKPLLGHRLSEVQRTLVLKILVVCFGAISVGVSFMMTYMDGTVNQAVIALLSPVIGSTTGMFLMGAWFPCANKYGAVAGPLSGFVIAAWLSVSSYFSGIKNQFLDLPIPNGTCSVDGDYKSEMLSNFSTTTTLAPNVSRALESAMLNTTALYDNITTTAIPDDGGSNIFEDFYSLSYLWINTIALTTCIVVGVLVSLITCASIPREEREVPTIYLMPFASRVCCCLPDSWLYYLDCCRTFVKPENVISSSEEPPPEKKHLMGRTPTYEMGEPSRRVRSYDFHR